MSVFEKGSVVRLKSGGPSMTVEDLGDYTPHGPENGAKCVWFEKTQLKNHIFDADSLETVEETPGGGLSIHTI